MTSKFTELAIGCADPNGLARFWCSVLDYEVQDEDDGIVAIGSPMVPEGKNHLGLLPWKGAARVVCHWAVPAPAWPRPVAGPRRSS